MSHVTMRLPKLALSYYQQFPNYTAKMRDVLQEHVRSNALARDLERHSSRIPLSKCDSGEILLETVDFLEKTVNQKALRVVEDYVLKNIRNVLVVDSEMDMRSRAEFSTALKVPLGEFLVRYERDVKRLFLATQVFRNYCHRYLIDYRDTLSKLKKMDVFVGPVVKRLGKGVRVETPAVHTLVFDYSKCDFSFLDAMSKKIETYDE